MRRVMKALNEEISNPDFGVDELSKRVGLSRTHLYRKLLKITSQSPVELIRNTRLQRAAQLLRENKLYVAEVVYMSGFKEISYFRKMFKDFYGLSPVEYSQSAKLV
jgi:AraC-like DNA-binding protein